MDSKITNESGELESLPPPPPTIPANVVPMKAEMGKAHKPGKEASSETEFLPMSRKGVGSKGQRIQLLSNHFRVGVGKKDGYFYHYSVFISLHSLTISLVCVRMHGFILRLRCHYYSRSCGKMCLTWPQLLW